MQRHVVVCDKCGAESTYGADGWVHVVWYKTEAHATYTVGPNEIDLCPVHAAKLREFSEWVRERP